MIIAYIPARGGSKRIPHKNLKRLRGRPILSHVLLTLKKLSFLRGVAVSTDDPAIAHLARQHGAAVLAPRLRALSGDHATFQDLLQKDLPRFLRHFGVGGEDAQVLFMTATAALVTPKILRAAYRDFKKFKPDALVAAAEYPISPYWALTESKPGLWKPVFPGKMAARSQDLPKALVDACLFYFLRPGPLRRYPRTWMASKKLMCFPVPPSVAVDVDTPRDWARLEHLCKGRKG